MAEATLHLFSRLNRVIIEGVVYFHWTCIISRYPTIPFPLFH
jgi:hypothetical protein